MDDEAHAWLERAKADLLAAKRLLGESLLSGIIAFHTQQAVEKALKAVIVVQQRKLVRTHDLKRLLVDVKGLSFEPDEEATLDELTSLYTASRYPGDIGLLPKGQPTENDLERFIALTEKIINQAAVTIRK